MNTLTSILIATAAAVAVALPLLRARGSEPVPARSVRPHYPDDDTIDEAVERYRAALRAGTVCERCYYPGPAHSRYCAECGHGIQPAGLER